MAFDRQRPAAPRFATADACPAPVLYVLPADAERDIGAAGLLAAEVAGLRHLGCPIVPFLLGHDTLDAEPELVAEARSAARRPAGGEAENPLRIAAGRPFGLVRAVRLAAQQRALPMREALALGARVAAAATRHGCRSIHATATDAAAIAALIGGRLAGLRVSVAATGRATGGATGRATGRKGPACAADLPLKLGAADLVVAPSREMAQALHRLAPQAKIHVVPRGLDAEWFRAGTKAPRNGRLLCMAPLIPRSGLEGLIVALALLPGAIRPVVDVIGAGPLLEPLRAEALEVGVSDHLRFLGARSRAWVAAEAPHYLGLVSPGVIAADDDHDPAPIAVLQAMALELPVLASALPGLREIVHPDAGHLVAPGQPEALAQGLRWLAIMPEEQRLRLGAAGRDRVLVDMTVAHRAAALERLLPRGRA